MHVIKLYFDRVRMPILYFKNTVFGIEKRRIMLVGRVFVWNVAWYIWRHLGKKTGLWNSKQRFL